jgi:hypothetical protein
MPYKAQAGENDTWDVVNADSGAVRATHQPPDAQSKAERQVKLLNQIEQDPAWDEADDNGTD